MTERDVYKRQAINPTPAGEGKTTTTVGLADGMQRLGKSVMVALREPSLGPVSYTHLFRHSPSKFSLVTPSLEPGAQGS